MTDPGPARDSGTPDEATQETAAGARAIASLRGAFDADAAEMNALLADLRRERDASSSKPPTLPDDFELLHEIGHGSTGVVYVARQKSLDRFVAIKILKATDLVFGNAIERFEREAKTLARLRHPHIVSVHEVGSSEGRLWFSMDLVDGRSLADRLTEGPLDPRYAARLLASVADAVHYVHEHGVVHRDLKPANILLDSAGEAVVSDFGLALEVGAEDGLTLTGQILGTPAYMSPEQARSDTTLVDARTDVYALGAVLYECLTGRRPFHGLSAPELVYAVIHQESPPPRKLLPSIPEPIERICVQAMRKRPEDRYASAAFLRDDLLRFANRQSVTAARTSLARRIGRRIARHRAAAGWVVAAGLALAVALGAGRGSSEGRMQESILDVAKTLDAGGDIDGALALYEHATGLGAGRPRERAIHERLTAARVRAVRRLVDSGRVSEALSRLDAALGETVTLADGGPADRGVLEWESATADALATPSTRTPDAHKKALLQLTQEIGANEARRWLEPVRTSGLTQPVNDRSALVRTLLDGIVARSKSGAPDARAAGRVELTGWLTNLQNEGTTLGLVRQSARDAPSMLGLLAEAAPHAFNEPAARLRSWMDSLPETRDGCAALYEVVRREERPMAERALATTLLSWLLDAPTACAFADPAMADDVSRMVAFFPTVRDADRESSLRRRARLAVEEWDRLVASRPNAFPFALGWIPTWLERRTGMPRPDAPQTALAWLDAHESVPCWTWLAARLAPPTSDVPPDTKSLLARWFSASPIQRHAIHGLLWLRLPPATAAPRFGLTSEPTPEALEAWQALLANAPTTLRARITRLVWRPTQGFSLDPAPERFVVVRSDADAVLSDEWEAQGEHSYASFHWPGAHSEAGVGRSRVGFSNTVHLGWIDSGLAVLGGSTSVWQFRAGSGSQTGGSFHEHWPSIVWSPELAELGGGTPDPGRHSIHLVAFEPESSPVTPWPLSAWRARVVEDIVRFTVAIEASATEPMVNRRFLFDFQGALIMLPRIAAWWGLPEAKAPLVRLSDAIRATSTFDWAQSCARLAAARAGDPSALAETSTDPARLANAEFLRRDEVLVWVRALSEGVSSEVGSVAGRRLDRILVDSDRDAAGDLRDAERSGRTRLTPALHDRLVAFGGADHSTWGLIRSAPWESGAAAVLWFVGLLAMGLAIAPRRRFVKRIAPAGWLVFVGVLFVAMDLALADRDVVPDVVGLVWASLGAAILWRSVRGRLASVPAIGFGAAAVASLASTWAPALAILTAISTVTAVGCLPPLMDRLRGRTRTGLPWPRTFFVFFVLSSVATACLELGRWLLGWPRTLSIASPVALLLIPLTIGYVVAMAWAPIMTVVAARIRATWLARRDTNPADASAESPVN